MSVAHVSDSSVGFGISRRTLSSCVPYLLCLFLVATNSFAQDQEDALAQAGRLETQGRFSEASLVLGAALDRKGLNDQQRERVEFQIDRLRRIKLDFPYTESALFTQLKKAVKDLTLREYQDWVQEGRFDNREIDGQRFFMVASVSNLFFRYAELNARRMPLKNSATMDARRWETCDAIRNQALAEKKPYVLPKHFHATMSVVVKADAVSDGQSIRAWLPIPRQYPFQADFELISSSSQPRHVDETASPARSIYLEEPARKGRPTEFEIQYDYSTLGVWFDLKPAKVQAVDPLDATLKPFLREGPHVEFTPAMRALSRQITGDESNPCSKARKFYNWIADNIKYSFAIEYSTIPNISEYCRARGYGDCGQESLLFITLCRLNGIPARWQSGWTIFPGATSNHDWAEIYLAPYGWVPVDPYMGIYAMRYATTLTPEKRRDIRDFYFGGLDQYRMIANSDHNQSLTPAKQTMRSDDVDFQRGELEWGSHNIYFDQFSFGLSAKEIHAPPRKIE